MKLHLSKGDGKNIVTAYGADHVTINGQRHESSLVVLPNELLTDWMVRNVEELTEAHIERILGHKPEVILLGTGKQLKFPAGPILGCAAQAGVGLEVMDTFAACRTYNILMSEGRFVAAALIFA